MKKYTGRGFLAAPGVAFVAVLLLRRNGLHNT